MFKIEDIIFRTIKCQLGEQNSRLWINRFLIFYGYISILRQIFAMFCHYCHYWHLMDYDPCFKVAIELILPSFFIVTCFLLLNIYSVCELQLILWIEMSTNGHYIYEVVVDNVEDFTFNNRDIFNSRYPFLTWLFQLFAKNGRTNSLKKMNQIKFKKNFQYISLVSKKVRRKLLIFVAFCEIIGITFRIFLGKPW